MSTVPSIAIILLSWKDSTDAIALAEKMGQWQQVQPLLILVENESKLGDEKEKVTANLIKVYSAKNRGYSGGNNLGIKAALAAGVDYVLLMNPDAEISEDNCLKLISTMQAHPQLFTIGPKLFEGQPGAFKVYAGGKDIGEHLNTRLPYDEGLHQSPLLTVDYTIGAIILIDAPKLKEIGLFDEAYFFSGEVGDLCKRARLAGYTCGTSMEAIGYHYSQPSTLRGTLYSYYSARNRLLYLQKFNFGKLDYLRWVKRFAIFAGMNFIFVGWKGLKAILLGVRDGVRGKFGNQNHYFIS